MTEITTLQAIEIDPLNGDFIADIPQHPADQVGPEYPHIVTTLCPGGFYTPRWDGTQWVEGKPQAELDETIREGKRQAIDSLREAKIANGLVYTFPDTGLPGTVQLRNSLDVRNVSGLGSAAHALMTLGNTNPLSFTDGENVVHSLAPSEMLNMTLAVQAFISELYVKARAKKDELAASSDPALYDIEAGW